MRLKYSFAMAIDLKEYLERDAVRNENYASPSLEFISPNKECFTYSSFWLEHSKGPGQLFLNGAGSKRDTILTNTKQEWEQSVESADISAQVHMLTSLWNIARIKQWRKREATWSRASAGSSKRAATSWEWRKVCPLSVKWHGHKMMTIQWQGYKLPLPQAIQVQNHVTLLWISDFWTYQALIDGSSIMKGNSYTSFEMYFEACFTEKWKLIYNKYRGFPSASQLLSCTMVTISTQLKKKKL